MVCCLYCIFSCIHLSIQLTPKFLIHANYCSKQQGHNFVPDENPCPYGAYAHSPVFSEDWLSKNQHLLISCCVFKTMLSCWTFTQTLKCDSCSQEMYNLSKEIKLIYIRESEGYGKERFPSRKHNEGRLWSKKTGLLQMLKRRKK